MFYYGTIFRCLFSPVRLFRARDKTEKNVGIKPSNDSLIANLPKGARPLLGKGNNKNVDAFANYGFYNYTSRILSDYLL